MIMLTIFLIPVKIVRTDTDRLVTMALLVIGSMCIDFVISSETVETATSIAEPDDLIDKKMSSFIVTRGIISMHVTKINK